MPNTKTKKKIRKPAIFRTRTHNCYTTPTRRLAMFSNTCAMTLAQKSDRILAQTRGLSGATPNATQLIEELRSALEENMKELERLRAERDEARRMYCGRVSRDVPLDAFDIAKNHGWDCFPQEDGK